LALLFGLGLVRSPGSALRYSGLALSVGWVATGLATSFALMAGLQPTVPEVIVLWALLAGAAVTLALRVAAAPSRVLRERGQLGRAVAFGAAALLVAAVVELLRRALASGPLDPDVWSFWLPRAKTIVYFGGIDTGVGGWTGFEHADYPPLVPTMEAVAFRFMGHIDPLLLPAQHWVIAVGVLAALVGLLATRVRAAVLWPSLAMLSFMPAFERMIGSSLGDEALTEMFALAGACAALWLMEARWRPAALCGLFLAAGALAKNEGLMLAVVLALMLVLTGGPRRRWATLLGLAAAPFAALGPWKIWLWVNHVHAGADYKFHDLFDPGYLSDRIHRLALAARSLPRFLFDPGALLLAVPLALALGAVLVAARRGRRLAAFGVGTIALAFAGYLAIYWIGRPEIHFYLDSSAGRVVVPIGVFATVLFPLLLSEALALGES